MIILFDLDGTLIDSTEAILESFHHTFESHGCSQRDTKMVKSLIGYPLDIMFYELGIEQENVWDFVATYKEHYRLISTQKTILLSNAREAIVKASGFAELGIVTTKTGEYSQILLEHFGLMQYFKVLIGREDVENPKPHEEPILKALESFNSDEKDIWMVGDTKLDLLCASNAQIKSIAVLSGYDTYKTLKKFTNVVLSDALEAVAYLEKRHISHK
ncbi:MAG TPA: hydrolase [Sulfurimonas sp. UBA12504]|nr:MAG: hydrolase [Sulfurimonas sp. GWF2_37_8]DAB29750.1 MAG TPA: hydrolase [Sulfurimonas sp. UBA12504]